MATPAQIAARKKFAERARSGELAKMRKKNPVKKPATKTATRKKNPITETLIYGLPRGEDRDFMEELLYAGGLKLNNQQVNQVLKAASDAGYHSFRITGFDPTVMPDFGVNVLNRPKRKRNPTATRAPARKRTQLVSNGERKNNPMNTRLPRVSSSGMKATDKALENSVAMLSRFLDLPNWKYNDPNAIGAIGINQAYGGVQLVQLATTGGGERDLSNRMTKKELMNFLDGAIMVAEALSQK